MSGAKAIKKLITAVCAALLLAVRTALPVSAASPDGVFSQSASEFFDGLEFGQSDWLALCRLRLYGTEGAEGFLSSVRRSAEELISSEGFVRPTELQRAAILLSAAGECPDGLMNAAVYNNESLDRQGFNAYIWALIAANCGTAPAPENALNTKQSLAEYIISKQLPDGGFTLRGTAADTDITAAAIYALAPLKEDERIAAALERAERCLTSLQLEGGGFMTMGIENCESAAQAMIAFAALGYGEEDGRVSAALSAMSEYSREDGFAHLPDGDASGAATAQAAEALTALELQKNGESLFSAPMSSSEELAPTTEQTSPETEQTASENGQGAPAESGGITGGQIKLLICIPLWAAGLALIAVFLAKGRKRTVLLGAGAACILAGAIVLLLDIRTPEEYYSHRPAEGGITVTVSADCGTALSHMEDIVPAINPPEAVPADGVLIYPTEVTIPEGSTAFDALIAAAREDRVQVDYTGTSYGLYIIGIGYVYEFGFGDASGWLYAVNGELPSASAGAYELSEGDAVEFLYTCELGDIRAPEAA